MVVFFEKSLVLEHPLFEIVKTTTGVTSIRNKVVGEIMHNPVGPWIEANSLYIEQSKLKNRLSENTQREFVVFDVGLGAAANALAALACVRSIKEKTRPFRMVSFEVDLELLRFALFHADKFEHFKGYELALSELLKNGSWVEENISWELRAGDFLEKIKHENNFADLIFYDPYSPKMNQDMWTTSCFKNLREKCRNAVEGGAALYTYSQSTRIRAALINAGFFVGFGAATGLKLDTTEATTDFKMLSSPLPKKWLDRWRRSDVRYPFDCKVEEQDDVGEWMAEYFNKYGIE